MDEDLHPDDGYWITRRKLHGIAPWPDTGGLGGPRDPLRTRGAVRTVGKGPSALVCDHRPSRPPGASRPLCPPGASKGSGRCYAPQSAAWPAGELAVARLSPPQR